MFAIFHKRRKSWGVGGTFNAYFCYFYFWPPIAKQRVASPSVGKNPGSGKV